MGRVLWAYHNPLTQPASKGPVAKPPCWRRQGLRRSCACTTAPTPTRLHLHQTATTPNPVHRPRAATCAQHRVHVSVRVNPKPPRLQGAGTRNMPAPQRTAATPPRRALHRDLLCKRHGGDAQPCSRAASLHHERWCMVAHLGDLTLSDTKREGNDCTVGDHGYLWRRYTGRFYRQRWINTFRHGTGDKCNNENC